MGRTSVSLLSRGHVKRIFPDSTSGTNDGNYRIGEGVTVEGYSEFYARTGLMHFKTVEDWEKTGHLLYEVYERALINLEAFCGSSTEVYQIRNVTLQVGSQNHLRASSTCSSGDFKSAISALGQRETTILNSTSVSIYHTPQE